MRYILRDDLPYTKWLKKAEELENELFNAADDEARKKIIMDNAKHWGKIKSLLLSFSHGKCWMSEARDVYSHPEVDHFRPKNVKAKNLDGSEREGYWWLAYNWLNYRICGNVGNRKKGSYFPLRNDSAVGTFTNRNIDDEVYYLLDPCEQDDPDLLSFDMEGKAIPSDHCGEWDRLRVEVTVEKLKLYHEPLQEARRDVWKTCENLINECENIAISFHANPSVSKRQKIRDIRAKLRDMMSAGAEFSRAAIACLCNSDTATARKILTPI
jgi:hypothetical protein